MSNFCTKTNFKQGGRSRGKSPENRGWQEEVTVTSKHAGAYMTWICVLRTVGRHGVLSTERAQIQPRRGQRSGTGYRDPGKLGQFQKADWVI